MTGFTLLIDENCDSDALVEAIASSGLIFKQVKTTPELGEGALDESVINFAIENNLVLLTEDRDINDYLAKSRAVSPSVIRIRTLRSVAAEEIV
jgi:predicted nuclease of predicted toxin-antitoxin system